MHASEGASAVSCPVGFLFFWLVVTAASFGPTWLRPPLRCTQLLCPGISQTACSSSLPSPSLPSSSLPPYPFLPAQ